ncbi:hypothetical protein CcCBS67573_g05857 [Chytriomyces confervae]|uniref:Charged multivesicular body protein 6 n=1 Tax=Chytriomyces confervae TaxID=246404 RepID=A0A507F9Q7_9FUNG|nr:hypothetical protein CcCBS67573_g05857 [Chytriomyces confervae]
MDAFKPVLDLVHAISTLDFQAFTAALLRVLDALFRMFLSVDWRMQVVIVISVLVTVRMTMSIARTTLRTAWWGVKACALLIALVKQPPKITQHDRAILDLKVQRDKIKKYQKKLAQVAESETRIAKSHLAKGDKRRALLALKKKKYQESLIEKADMQLLNLEQMTDTIEFALIERDILEGLKQGNTVLKEIHKEMNVEAVQQLMDDTADAIAYQNEIDEILGGKLSDADMEDIEEELEALVAAEFAAMPKIPENQLPSAQIDLELPDVPAQEPSEPIQERRQKQKVKAQEEPMLAS